MVDIRDSNFRRYVNVPQSSDYVKAEERRLLRQASCTHDITVTFKKYDKYSERCEQCLKVLSSDATRETEIKSHEQML